MKVYVVTWFSAEQYDDTRGTHSVWFSKEDAEEYVENNKGIMGADPKHYDEGFYLSSYITEHEVQ